jgi:hypothetical protein
MSDDKLSKDEEISAEELEQVSGGMTKQDLTAFKFVQEAPVASIDAFKLNTTIINK